MRKFQKMSNFLTSFKSNANDNSKTAVDMTETFTQLHLAASNGDKSTLKRVIEIASDDMLEAKDHLGQTALMFSVVRNQVDCMSALLKAGARVDNSDNTGQTALHIAANKGFHHCVKLLLSKGALWHQTDLEGVTALHAAAIHSSSKCLSLILKELKPGEVDIQDSNKKTALHWSAAYANVEHLKLLLKQDANVCIPDSEGKTPLHWAASSSDSKALLCLKILLEEEPSVINWQDYEGHSALHLCVSTGTAQMVDFLTSHKNCNLNILDNSFNTPLHWAARQGLADKVALLLDRGAIYTCADGYGATALHYAAYHNRVEAVKVFLSRSYIHDVPDCDGRTALMWAAARKADQVIHMMAKFRLNLSHKDKSGSTALHAAAIQGHASTTELLLALNATVDAEDDAGMTPFLRACELGRFKVIQILLKKGASVSARDRNKRTGLHWASKEGHAYLCQMLIQHGCQCDVQDKFGMTPLHYASAGGYTGCVSVLLESRANAEIADKEGKTPLHLAAIENHLDTSKLLIEHGAYVNTMAMLDQWATPLDFAIHHGNTDISQFLQNVGGLTAFQIESVATKKIQDWCRNVIAKRKNTSNRSHEAGQEYSLKNKNHKNSAKYLEKEVPSSGSTSALNILEFREETDNQPHSLIKSFHSKIPIAVCNLKHTRAQNVFSKHGRISKNMEEVQEKEPPMIQKQLHKVKQNHFVTVVEIHESSVVEKHAQTVEQKHEQKVQKHTREYAALTIQKAWRKFLLKKKMIDMRKKINETFPTLECRRAAEEEWSHNLNAFLNQI